MNIKTVLFDYGSIHIRIDERGVGHIDLGQGNSIVNRKALERELEDIARLAQEGLVKLREGT